LRRLSTFQFASAGLLVIQLPLLFWLIFLLGWYLNGRRGIPSISVFIAQMRKVGPDLVPSVVFSAVVALLTLHSGQQIARRRWRIYSVVVACLECLVIPIGIFLGLFTMLSLFTRRTKEAYVSRTEGIKTPGAAPLLTK